MCPRTLRGRVGLTFLETGFGDGDHLDARHTIGVERLVKYREVSANELLAVRVQLVCRVGDEEHRSPDRFEHFDGDDPIEGAFPALGEAVIVSKSTAMNLRRRDQYEAESTRLVSTHAR